MYGAALRLPLELLHSSTTDHIDPASYVERLKVAMQQPQVIPLCLYFHRKVQVRDDLFHCMHIFMWHDPVRKSWQQPYKGPCKVSKYADKMYMIEVNGQQEILWTGSSQLTWTKQHLLNRIPPAAHSYLLHLPTCHDLDNNYSPRTTHPLAWLIYILIVLHLFTGGCVM